MNKDKNNQVKLFVLMMCLAMLSFMELTFISAQQVFKQNDPVDLKIQCIINGTYCSASALCNITISNPDGSLLINNQAMQHQGSNFNITLPSTTVLGNYLCSATCCDGSYCGTGTDCDFSITPTGDGNNIGFYVMLSIILIGILLFGVFTKNIPVTLVGGMMTMGWGLYIAINGFDTFKNTATEFLAVGVIALGAIWVGIAGLEYFDVI